jgi:uncharacterized protein (DUF1499 family)
MALPRACCRFHDSSGVYTVAAQDSRVRKRALDRLAVSAFYAPARRGERRIDAHVLQAPAMISRIAERRSKLAGTSARLAALSVPVLIMAALGHRSGQLTATPTYAVMAVGFSLAGLAVITALVAFAGIWRDGRKGAGAAARGLLIGLLVLALPAIGAWKLVTLPRLVDISTDPENPPDFEKAAADRAADDEPIQQPDADEIAAQRDAYPDIVPRHYPVSTARVYQEAHAIVADRRWRILEAREPSDTDETAHIEAVATTLVFGFRQDVAIRIVPDGDGALLDMRSAARNAAHDLGSDADRIRSFLADLDTALQGVSGGS